VTHPATVFFGCALATIIAASPANAAETVTVGALYALSAAADAKAAIEIGVDIVNAPHPWLDKLPLGAGEGLPNLGNAKLAVIFADHQGNPSVAQSQVLRLIEQNHVAALIGGGEGPAMLTETAEADRHGIPFLVADTIEAKITGRGLARIFRTDPLGSDFTKAYIQFLIAQKAAGAKIDRVALVFGNDARGVEAARQLSEAAQAAGFAVDTIGYSPDGIDVSAAVTALRDKQPDAAIFGCDAADASLFIKTMKTLDYKPPILIGDDAGFSVPGFVAADGNLAQGLIDRSVWSVGDADSPSAIVNGLYKAKTGHDLDDASARLLQGFLVLADAINRAGSADPAALQKALRETDLKPNQLIVGYDGVKFDANGQNTLAATYLTQLRGKGYVTVWPAERAPAKLVLPYKAWQQ
jgi:branched-chain amino acid transport system substrate-binding protein